MKDRITLLTDKLQRQLCEYKQHYKPRTWLFEGDKGDQYSASSLQKVLQAALLKSGIKREATLHTLRHSFSTHFLESGTDIRYLHALLGTIQAKPRRSIRMLPSKDLKRLRVPWTVLASDLHNTSLFSRIDAPRVDNKEEIYVTDVYIR